MSHPRRAFMRLNGAVLAVCASTIGLSSAMPAPAETAAPTPAGQLVYTYAVRHPLYGKIGTFTDTIDRKPETMRIDGRLRIAVKFLGIVVYRQESDITAIMRDDRLVSLQSATNKDGEYLEVRGEAQGDEFVVNASAGSFAGPATSLPSDPFVLKGTGEGTMVFTDTGEIINVQVSGGDHGTVSVNGDSVSARHFIIEGVTRREVWLDNQGIPVKFRVVENGTPIDFVLQNTTASPGTTVAALQRPVLVGLENGDK
jgi:hypothetical protein